MKAAAWTRSERLSGRGPEGLEQPTREHRADVAERPRADPHGLLSRRSPLDRGTEVVEAHEEPHRSCDLDVGGVRLLAADGALGDELVDAVEETRQRREVGLD